MRRHNRVRAAILKLLETTDDDFNPDEDITEKDAKQLDEITNCVIELWDALNDKSY